MQLNAAVQEIRARQVFAGRAHLMPINALAFPLQLPPHSFTAPPSLLFPSLSLFGPVFYFSFYWYQNFGELVLKN
jgi:hypothetical protein